MHPGAENRVVYFAVGGARRTLDRGIANCLPIRQLAQLALNNMNGRVEFFHKSDRSVPRIMGGICIVAPILVIPLCLSASYDLAPNLFGATIVVAFSALCYRLFKALIEQHKRTWLLAGAWDDAELWLEQAGVRKWTLPWVDLAGVEALCFGKFAFGHAIALEVRAGSDRCLPVCWSQPNLSHDAVLEAIKAHLPPGAKVPGRYPYTPQPAIVPICIALILFLALLGWSIWLLSRMTNQGEFPMRTLVVPLLCLGVLLWILFEIGVIIALRRAGKNWVPPTCIKRPPSY